MERKDNYRIQADQAKQTFLRYDQQKLIQKLKLKSDLDYLYTELFSQPYRIHRRTANIERQKNGEWTSANSHSEVMTLLDLICDSREDRFLSGRWKNMSDFGRAFHQNLLEDARDPWAELFQSEPDRFRQACEALGGQPLSTGDIAYAIELFDGLSIAVQLWLGDEEFPPRLRLLWDENALMYLKYETMYYARALLLARIREEMAPQEEPHG